MQIKMRLEMLENGGCYTFSPPVMADGGVFESGVFMAFMEWDKGDALLLFLNGEKPFGVKASYLNEQKITLCFCGSIKNTTRTLH